ncbi:conserved hypothetical protein [Stutzerimonas stutzeri A1501]|uniref:Uncharacterized protein n=1 Tax=Stutzerimonas stutzeri (strain A1501) TaxID=379731 RepID=A4VRS3_STUS1|nr:conserved hypothetical protein [Stutzerimonas stutzeri A1501]
MQPPLRAAIDASDTRSAAAAEDQRCHEQHQEDHEQDLRNTCSSACDTTEAQDCSDDGNDQEGNGPTQHGVTPLGSGTVLSGSDQSDRHRLLLRIPAGSLARPLRCSEHPALLGRRLAIIDGLRFLSGSHELNRLSVVHTDSFRGILLRLAERLRQRALGTHDQHDNRSREETLAG